MSVSGNQDVTNYQTKNRMEQVYEKFQKAQRNMSNFQQMLTKFETKKKPQQNEPTVSQFNANDQKNIGEGKCINLVLEKGWQYSGQVFQQKFHGFGNLMLNQESIYSGKFKNGKMHGIGTLYFNQVFEQLISIEVQWKKFEGQFLNGLVTGFGNLYLRDGGVISGFWRIGKPHLFTRVSQNLISNCEQQ